MSSYILEVTLRSSQNAWWYSVTAVRCFSCLFWWWWWQVKLIKRLPSLILGDFKFNGFRGVCGDIINHCLSVNKTFDCEVLGFDADGCFWEGFQFVIRGSVRVLGKYGLRMLPFRRSEVAGACLFVILLTSYSVQISATRSFLFVVFEIRRKRRRTSNRSGSATQRTGTICWHLAVLAGVCCEIDKGCYSVIIYSEL